MVPTISYGDWSSHCGGGLTVKISVAAFLGESAENFDVDTIAARYRDAIDQALPPNVSLCGDEFYGPHYEMDQHFENHPKTDQGALDIATIITKVDLAEIARQHKKTSL
ncbi:hypothetical protein AB0C84_45305 [Actinomadura sp. NPDC048955]|uniref:hypothetical protein n=1 Tax=Actinomadura sp. NPDC048955 TaxID=3158228 RepID=UPI0033DA899C